MGVVKRTLKLALRKWQAQKLMTAHNQISRRRQLERAWPHPLTHEKRQELKQGLRALSH